MRVTMLCLEWPSENHSGGVARYAYRMASDLRSLVDLSVITTEGGLDLPGANVIKIRKPRSRFDRYYVLPFVARGVVRRQAPDVIHSFGDDWLLSRKDAPVVRSFFGSSWSEAKSSSGVRRLNHALLALTEKYTQWKSDIRIAIAPETVSLFKCHRLMPPVTAVRTRERRPTDNPSVIFIGSYKGRKRGQFAEQAVQEVATRIQQEIKFTVIGPASDRDLWHPDTNHVSSAADEEVLELIGQSWVLISPSLYEGFGIPVFEAMSLGTAALASVNPGSSYLKSLCANSNALLVADSDSEFISMLEEQISRGPKLGEADSASGKEVVETMLDLASIDRLVDDVYRPAVQAGRK